MNTADQILFLLKTRGAKTAQQLAAMLDLTSMGTRRHLEAAEEKGLVRFEDVAEKVGRPSRRWLLTDAGHARFPDRHADLTLQLITQIRSLFGEAGMEKLIVAREQASEEFYRNTVGQDAPLAVLRQRAPSLFDYFHQLFAQVTNPPIDPIREAMVMSLATSIGPDGNTFDETPEHCYRLSLPGPILTNEHVARLKGRQANRCPPAGAIG